MSDPSSHQQPIRSEFAGDPDMAELIQLFLQELPSRVDALKKAHEARDADTLKRMSHQLRGASAGYGFPSLGLAAGAVEDRLRTLASEVQSNPQALTKIGNELTQLIDMSAGRGLIPTESNMTQRVTQFEATRPIVLVIDDSVDVHRLLKARLRHEELELRAATSGEEALSLVKSLKPTIILLDLDMPGMDGFQVLRILKSDAATMDMPIIVLSALASAQDKVTAFDLGAVDYVTKPFNLTELRVRVRSALRLHRLVEMLAERAQIDGLTGLWNRAYFDRRWSEEVGKTARRDRPLSLAMLDIDHFKSINDTYGHPAGDAVLQGVARLIQRECRQEDVACRYGGEEFTLILPDTNPTEAANLCDRIRQSFVSSVWPRHPERTVTVSIGLTGFDKPGDISAARWLENADRALYAAKQRGRNMVVSCGPDGSPTIAAAA